jgi:hypothetical protein
MAQAVTAVRAYVVERDEPVTKRFWQNLVIETTGLVSDNSYDFGAYLNGALGTFWTAVSGSANGALALALIQDIATMSQIYLGVQGPVLIARVKVASAPAVGQYTEALVNAAETVGFNVADAPTVAQWVFTWELQPNTHGIKSPVS